jgi:hypothetical protein
MLYSPLNPPNKALAKDNFYNAALLVIALLSTFYARSLLNLAF